MAAPFHDIGQRRTRKHSTRKPGNALTFRLVIGIELIAPARVAGDMAGEMRLKNEGVEEPSGVS